jgi:hypothetical protein
VCEFVLLRVHFLDALNGSVVGLVVQVQTIGLDVCTQELKAALIGLVIELLLVHPYTFLRQPLPQFWK